MTSVVGIVCEDAVVIGSDSSATSSNGQFSIMEQTTIKLREFDHRYIMGGTGEVGLDQRFEEIINKYTQEKKDTAIKITRTLSARAIDDFSATGIKIDYIRYGCLFGFFAENRPYLCEFAIKTFQPELKTSHQWFSTIGSGQIITDPFLALLKNIFWEKTRPSKNDAIFAVNWALQHVIDINPGGIKGPIRIKVLENKNNIPTIQTIEGELLFEHNQNIEDCKQALRDVQEKHKNSGIIAQEIPTPNK